MGRRYLKGASNEPLLIAYHGLLQKSAGLLSYLPWYKSFPHMSQILDTCRELKWSCYLPQSEGLVFRIDKTLSHVWRARELTESLGKLYFFGFSMGAETAYEAANYLNKNSLDEGCLPCGLWAHSGRAPRIKDFKVRAPYKVAVSCNEEETHPLPFNCGRSMLDERQLAYDFYSSHNIAVKEFSGTAGGKRPVHRCDPELNRKVLQWLAA